MNVIYIDFQEKKKVDKEYWKYWIMKIDFDHDYNSVYV